MMPSSSSLKAKTKIAMLSLSLLAIFALLATACGGGPTTQQGKQPRNTVVSIPSTGPFTENFNPWAPNNRPGTRGMIYETLLYMNSLQGGEVTPWLASGYQFSSDATTLTFQLRQHVQWSDGQAFSSADVVFTLNMLKQYPATDLNALWKYLKTVSAPDANTIVVTLNKPYSPILWYLGGQSWIIPQHIWSSIGNPTKYTNPHPVGTGPFTLKTWNSQIVDLVKNPNFWQPGKPEVTEIHYLAVNSNTSSELLLEQGKVDWSGQFLPDVQKSFVSRDPAHNHYWFPPVSTNLLYLNLTKYPFNILAVRQAISLAIDRQQMNTAGESGYEPAAHPSGLVLPAQQQYLAPQYAQASFTIDTNKAMQLLESAGFTKGSDGFYADKNGKQLAFNMNVVTGFTDWVTDLQIMSSNLKAVGINASVNALSFNAYYNAMQSGSFDTAISWANTGPTPFFFFDGVLNSKNSAPIGKNANSNWERWNDPTTDSLLEQYASTTDPNAQAQALYGIQKIMTEQLPSIPLNLGASWGEFSTLRFTGWPDEHNPYAAPQKDRTPDNEIIILHLHPVG
ncbi:MAG TPA: ABC transporter substrate-binding protein [Ktedonosporobacter sp.]|nr:ABC transporter substrate-binding protein [Ktedonosporobacter sp.]